MCCSCCVQGLLRSIGVSNFGIPHLEKLAATSTITPAVNQVNIWTAALEGFCFA